jgi:5-epi-alpha-selinene synthase
MKTQAASKSPPRQDDIVQHSLLPTLCSTLIDTDYQLRSLRWAERFGLLPTQVAFLKAAQIQVDELACMTYRTSDPELRQICTDVLLWFFLADDQFDERVCGYLPEQMHAVAKRFVDVLRTGDAALAVCPLSLALLDLRARFLKQMEQAWLERFARNMQRYLDGCIQEAKNRANGTTPSRVEYRDIRRASVGTYPCFDVIELAMQQMLPAALDQHEDLADLRDVATDVIAWINDIVSFRKESAFADPHNLISVLMGEEQLDVRSATLAAHALIRLRTADWERLMLAGKVRFSDPAAQEYIAGLNSWVEGVREWSYRSRRYSPDYLQLSKDAQYDLLARSQANRSAG